MSATSLAGGALVLAGGLSTRMGRDKATLPFGGRTLLEHVLARLAPCVTETVVVTRAEQTLPPLPEDVQYRFAGKHLLLFDAKANIIIDFMLNAIP